MKKINWRYAIGELIIITIGITVAFGLNRWAEGITHREEEREYLANIKNDLAHDIAVLDSNLLEFEARKGYLKSFIPHLHRKMPERDTMAVKIFKMADPIPFRPMESTIQSMKFSGDLKLITDLNLKNEIIEHYSVYDHTASEQERHATFAKDHLAVYFMQNIDYGKFRQQDGFDFVEEPLFRNLVYALYGIYEIGMKAQQEALESARNLHQKL